MPGAVSRRPLGLLAGALLVVVSTAWGSAPAQVLAGLKSRIPSISASTVYTADSDPNKLLGRPGQYLSKPGVSRRKGGPSRGRVRN